MIVLVKKIAARMWVIRSGKLKPFDEARTVSAFCSAINSRAAIITNKNNDGGNARNNGAHLI